MRESPIFKIVWAHLTGRKRQTIVSMLGVMFGITVFIFQAGMITGLQNYFIEKTINSTPHIQISNETNASDEPIAAKAYEESDDIWFSVRNQKERDDIDKIKDGLQIASILENLPEVYGVSPSLTSQAIFKLGVSDVSAMVYGVDIRKENRLFNLEKDIVQGSIIRLETVNNGLVLGSGLAEKLGASLNDNLKIVSPSGVTLTMKVVGIITTGLRDLDNQRAYASLRNAQKLLKVQSSYITDISIKLKDIDKAEVLAKEFENRFGYQAEDWKVKNAAVFSVFKIQNIVTYLVIISIMVVSGFGIFNIITMMIYEKMKDIAILKALGFTDKDIRRIFLSEALLIGFAGGVLGVVLGLIVSVIASSIPFKVEGFVTSERLSVNFNPIFYTIAFLFGLLTTAIAGLLPARKAAKVDPLQIIRNQ
jgi:lipoprotein-releasing system permease protein